MQLLEDLRGGEAAPAVREVRRHRRFLLAAVLALVLAVPAAASRAVPVTGRVLAAGGAPVAGARAELFSLARSDDAPRPVASAVTGRGGDFRLAAPRPGMWRVRVTAPGFVPVERALVPLTERRALAPMTLTADRGVGVRVLGADGTPSAGAYVVAVPLAAPATSGWRPAERRGRTDETGTLRLPRGEDEALVPRAWAPGRAESATGFVAAGSTAEASVTLTLGDGIARPLRVKGADGRPLAGVLVRVGEGGWTAGLTDDEGTLTVHVAAGEPLPLELRAPGYLPFSTVAEPGTGTLELTLEPGTELRGRVSDAQSGAPLAGALCWRRDDPAGFVHSRDDGSFILTAAEGDDFTLAVAIQGYLAWERAERVDGTVREVSLVPAAPRGGSVFGRVLDVEGQPIAEVVVRLSSQEGDDPPSIATGADGQFELPTVAPGLYEVSARAPGWKPFSVPGVEVPAGPGPHDLGTLVLEPGDVIRGRVVDGDGVAVGKARVSIAEEKGTDIAAAVTGEDGSFELTGLAAGRRLDLEVWADGHVPRRVAAVVTPEPITIVLDTASRLSGRVVAADGRGLEDAVVTATAIAAEAGTSLSSRVTATGEDGSFRFTDLASGRLELVAEHAGYARARPVEVALGPGEEREGLELTLNTGGVVEGWVRTPDGREVGDARVEALPPEGRGRTLAVAETDASGHYRLDGLPAGPLRISAGHQSFLPASATVVVRPGVNDLDLVLDPGRQVSGRVMDVRGAAIAGAEVRLEPSPGEGRTGEPPRPLVRGTTDSQGAFVLGGLLGGLYRLVVEKHGFAAATYPGIDLDGGSRGGIEVVMDAGLEVTGRISGVGPEDLAKVRVTAVSSDGLIVRGRVRYDGTYRVTDLAPGEWTLGAALEGTDRQAIVSTTMAFGMPVVEIDVELPPVESP